MADYRIGRNAGGEVLITALSEKATQMRGHTQGHSLVFRSAREAREYIDVAEAEGLTFEGKELLGA